MTSYNKVFLIGNLTRNPEIRYTNNQTAICSFGIAVNQGTCEKPETYFGECVCFGKTAEIVPRFTGKGSSVLVEGSLKNDQWQDRKKRRDTEQNADLCPEHKVPGSAGRKRTPGIRRGSQV